MFDDESTVIENQQQESIETQEEQVRQPVNQPEVETQQAKNFRALREKAEKLERERDEAVRYVQQLQSTKQEPVEEDDLGIEDDALTEGRHLKKAYKKQQQELREMRKQVEQVTKQSTMANTEAKLRSQYPDFDKVVNAENIKLFMAAYPELASTLNASTDVYNTAVSAYTMIKKFGIVSDEDTNPEKQRAHNNLNKPRPLTSISPQQGDTPMSRANAFAEGLTDELKSQLLKEMYHHRKSF